MGVQLFHADGQTDGETDEWLDGHEESNFAFRNFSNAPKLNVNVLLYGTCKSKEKAACTFQH